MEEKRNILNELNELNAIETQKVKDNGFTIPDAYFATLEQRIISLTEDRGEQVSDRKEKPIVRRISSLKSNVFRIGIAASFVGILIGFAFLTYIINIGGNQDQLTWNDISKTDIEEYINENISSFDNETIAGLYDEYSIDQLNISSILPEYDIEEYLFEYYDLTEEELL